MRDATRAKLERELSRELQSAFADYQNPEQLARDVADKAQPVLKKAEEEAAVLMVLILLAMLDEDESPGFERAVQSAVGASTYSAGRAVTLGRTIADTTVNREDLTAERAERIAATEVTAAATSGQTIGRDVAQRVPGLRIKMYWSTRQDSRVCDVCGPLHNQPEEVWAEISPGGPPAHPNCRCSLLARPRVLGVGEP